MIGGKWVCVNELKGIWYLNTIKSGYLALSNHLTTGSLSEIGGY